MADSTQGLQHLLSYLVRKSKKWGFKINKKKMKIMVLSKRTKIPCSNIFQDREKLDQINQFNYLGKEIRRRIALAKKALQRREPFLQKRSYVRSTLLNGCESWTTRSNCRKRLEALEIWHYHKMTRSSWFNKISNECVLYIMGMERSLLVTIRRRQLRFVGHVVRKVGLEKLVLIGKINGKRQRGAQ